MQTPFPQRPVVQTDLAQTDLANTPLSALARSQSLVANYLTHAVYLALKDKVTPSGSTLQQAIQSNVDNPDSAIGFYAMDAASYQIFAPLLNPIIKAYHGNIPDRQSGLIMPLDDAKKSAWRFEAGAESLIVSTRIRTARNLADFAFGGMLMPKDRQAVQSQIVDALATLPAALQGQYETIQAMDEQRQSALIASHYLFKQGDRFLASAGLNNDWPNNRGIFLAADKRFLVWVNEEDHLRIISMQKGHDISSVYERLVMAFDCLQQHLNFAEDPRLGVLASCPTNIGTGIRASVHIRLPHLAQQGERLKALANRYHLQVRGQAGEHSDNAGNPIVDLSNRRRLGLSALDCINDLVLGVNAIIREEKRLSR
ncbi:phosphagen kinase [Ostreibacterium oceani]|uniref:Arginine kinase n=1 Tax=Ostreibacterium oceani TaxID=2654998 RepID=A0A6N7EXE8_9GAMM|nr:phosphagen kinase [Ostreibacterium oceani]MPV86220.1 arginine kinase [Ostreibacterium oceani]